MNSGAESLCAREIARAYCSLSPPFSQSARGRLIPLSGDLALGLNSFVVRFFVVFFAPVRAFSEFSGVVMLLL